jgi:Tfp pilus assembly protein PilF
LPPSVGSSIVAASSTTSKPPLERIKRNYEEDAFRQMTVQIGSWAEERFVRSDPHAHARFHVELGKELLAHGFTTEAESEFRHAAAVDPTSTAPLTALAEDYDARGDAADARAQAEAALRIRESADAYLILARLDLKENKMEAAAAEHRSRAATGAWQFRRPGPEAHPSSQARGESAAAVTAMKSAISSQSQLPGTVVFV